MQNTYDFCPKCGAVVRNGVCTSCGAAFGEAEAINKVEEERTENTDGILEEKSMENQAMDQQPEKAPVENAPIWDNRTRPGADNYYGGQAPAGYSNEGGKRNTGIWVAALTATFLVVVILVVYIGSEIGRISKGDFIADIKNTIEEAFRETEEDGAGRQEEYSVDSEADEDYWNQYEDEQAFSYDKNFTEERKNYDASQITGPYYEEFVNCIDESVSYKVKREFFEKVEEEQGICIQVSYIQLEGDIPNLEAINEKLKAEGMALADWYMEDEGSYQAIRKEYDFITFYVKVESTVTVNDEESISIALDERFEMGGYSSFINMSGININLKTGTILNNTEILDVDEEFVKDFVKRSNAQNGKNSVAIDGISDMEKLQLLRDEESLILFYTPIGLEVGYNYSGTEGYTGWITVSLEDYEQYLKGY
ncbi:MAG: zinc ribbon domain-containing protein [Roseburia sp.]|nr:zinc ribbon domain-containing protein [Roseburia sp.]MCM1278478.1 zinc ribbon domain-containing protein [Robinsoniella sp.]